MESISISPQRAHLKALSVSRSAVARSEDATTGLVELRVRELKNIQPGCCAEGYVLPEFQGYVLIIGTWRGIKCHFQKKIKRNGFNGLEEI